MLPTSPDQAKALLRRLGLRPKKRLGQHFLIDESVRERVAAAAELSPDDIVIEVGPGLGELTGELARRAGRVVAIEVDQKLASHLSRRLSGYSNLIIVPADILHTDPALWVGAGPYKVVANLPYYITSPVLRHFLEATPQPQRMVVMVQKEVAQSLAAPPGQMSLLSVSVQFYGHPSIVAYVPPSSFYPPPKVDSAIVRIDVYPQPKVAVEDVAAFFRVVRAGFSAPRKQLRNTLGLGLGLSPHLALSLLEKAQISPRRRPQSLTLEEWARLYQAVHGAGSC